MKTKIKILSIVAMFAFCADLPPARAAAIYTTSVQLNSSPTLQIWAWTEPNLGGVGAGLFMAIDSNRILRPTNYSVGIGHAWYSVLPDQILDPNFAATATPFANAFTGDLSGRINMTVGQTFLLGFWLDANGSRTPNAGDRFGWARLLRTSSGLSLIDNAIESEGGGIIAGTTTTVPEPTSTTLMVFGSLWIFMRRAFRNDRNAQTPVVCES